MPPAPPALHAPPDTARALSATPCVAGGTASSARRARFKMAPPPPLPRTNRTSLVPPRTIRTSLVPPPVLRGRDVCAVPTVLENVVANLDVDVRPRRAAPRRRPGASARPRTLHPAPRRRAPGALGPLCSLLTAHGRAAEPGLARQLRAVGRADRPRRGRCHLRGSPAPRRATPPCAEAFDGVRAYVSWLRTYIFPRPDARPLSLASPPASPRRSPAAGSAPGRRRPATRRSTAQGARGAPCAQRCGSAPPSGFAARAARGGATATRGRPSTLATLSRLPPRPAAGGGSTTQLPRPPRSNRRRARAPARPRARAPPRAATRPAAVRAGRQLAPASLGAKATDTTAAPPPERRAVPGAAGGG